MVAMAARRSKSEFKIFGSDYNTKDGTAIRDLIHVCDVASAHTKALELKEKLQIYLENEEYEKAAAVRDELSKRTNED